jgi:hypothetical protein
LTDEMVHIFSAYHRPRTVSKGSAIVVVHPSAGFEASVQADWMRATVRLCDAASGMGYPAILSIPPGTEPAPALRLQRYLQRCLRPCDSAFFFSDLSAVLTRNGIDGVILCGAPTSGAIRATAVEAKSYGFRAAIAEETTGDEAALLHKMALFDIAHKYADVMTLEELVSALQDRTGR